MRLQSGRVALRTRSGMNLDPSSTLTPRPFCKLNFIDIDIRSALVWTDLVCGGFGRESITTTLVLQSILLLALAWGGNQETFSQRQEMMKGRDDHTERKRVVDTCVCSLRLMYKVHMNEVPMSNAHYPSCCTLYTHRRPGPRKCASS